jgi:hypothetical protein
MVEEGHDAPLGRIYQISCKSRDKKAQCADCMQDVLKLKICMSSRAGDKKVVSLEEMLCRGPKKWRVKVGESHLSIFPRRTCNACVPGLERTRRIPNCATCCYAVGNDTTMSG